jgi:hypothetical protein
MGRLLDLCLLAYPRQRRTRDGAHLHDLASELAASNGVAREAFGLLRGGLAARWGDRRRRRRRVAIIAVAATVATAGLGVAATTDAHVRVEVVQPDRTTGR